MDEWKRSADGNWILTIGEQSLALPIDFEQESSSRDSVEFIALGPDREICMVQYRQTRASEVMAFLSNNQALNRCDRADMSGLSVAEFEPASYDEKRKLGIRSVVLELTPKTALLVTDANRSGRDEFVRSLSEQWSS